MGNPLSSRPTLLWALRTIALALIFTAINYHGAAAQTTITTKDGKQYHGKVVNEGAESVTLITSDSVEAKVPRAQIQSITYSDSTFEDANLPTLVRKTPFPVFGVALGSPAGINLITGYYFNNFGFRISGMYLSRIYGVEVEFLRNIGRSKSGNFSNNIHLGLGTLTVQNEDWNYVAVGYDLNWSGFHLSTGISFGGGSFESPQILLQLGYVHEYR